MMVSTMGFTITKHYCGEDLIDLSIAGEVENCWGYSASLRICGARNWKMSEKFHHIFFQHCGPATIAERGRSFQKRPYG